jgi:hypothetical protein
VGNASGRGRTLTDDKYGGDGVLFGDTVGKGGSGTDVALGRRRDRFGWTKRAAVWARNESSVCGREVGDATG